MPMLRVTLRRLIEETTDVEVECDSEEDALAMLTPDRLSGATWHREDLSGAAVLHVEEVATV